MYEWEAFFIGDNCPHFEELMKSQEVLDLQELCSSRGSSLILENRSVHTGGCGYDITNENIQRASGTYTVFYANDDILLPTHFENYLKGIEGTEFGFVYYNSFVTPYNSIRYSALQGGQIGHSELIIRTSDLKQMPPHTAEYGHDWKLIESLMSSCSYTKVESEPTYIVMSVPGSVETGID